jgi:hypothetical protein
MIHLSPCVTWHDAQGVLINWGPLHNLHSNPEFRYSLMRCDLYLVAPHAAHVLRVNKMRQSCLSLYQPQLDELFDEYIMDVTSWRGHIMISDSDLVKWHLQLG